MPSSVAYSETRTLANDHNARALNGSYRLGREPLEMPSRPDEARKNEDIFLNIARTDSDRRDSLGRSDFRRSRLGYSSQSLRSPTTRFDTEQTPSPDQRLSNAESPLLAQNESPTLAYSSLHTPAASSHPLDDHNRFRYSSLGSGARSTIGAPRSRLSRTSPEASPHSASVSGERRSSFHEPRLQRNSTLSTVRSSRQPSTSEATERIRGEAEKSRADGTESTLSTNAPSTVWDELDDLKSRIRKLELTGKLPPSSQAAISGTSNERPRTAATTMTAISTSPRHHRKASTSAADAESVVHDQVHPLLQSALAKAKVVLSSDVYSALDATITDALKLSTLLGANTTPSGTVSVVNGGYTSSERQARRKADSVCRSLTELCLALTDEQLKKTRPSSSHASTVQPQRSNGGENESLAPGSSYQRTINHEPENVERRQSTSRISSRLEARRASLINHSPSNPTEAKSPQSPSVAPPPSRLHRASTTLRNRRLTFDDENGEISSPHSRSLSRAATEIGTPSPAQNVSPRQRFSYSHSRSAPALSQAPPTPQAFTPQPRTPTVSSQTGIPARRSYMTPGVYSPAAPRSNIQAGSRRYGLSTSFSNATPRSGAEESPRSPQVESPKTRIGIPSSKTATSYTPIQQPRLRTNSLGARRFGLRTRSSTAPDESANIDDSID
ncbi:hypothetical protein N7509_008749 [Penicillium cosmopolitanum]|uniref:LPXTG-motif cell wall anchor domain protein n=1 Tax=Penicillium cosmopolitanum TaxID=1131564 RepID=A0A9X0B2Z6_9EURO|nr:uncharacterized protein N7509_008749 [Penicillium cosmopolitanum]KAJ5386208.1 hypothetical protein N7509_008749 [Penicillium cosmopolitanum]